MSRTKPVVRVFRNDSGWALPDYTDLADCTSNHQRQQDGQSACTEPAVWKVIEDYGLSMTISFWCDTDLPAAHRSRQIRQQAHRLAAEGLAAALNMWELDRYYTDPGDQQTLESELLKIAARLRKQGGVA